MFDLIGSVRDLFSSPYNNHPIASEGIIVKLWCSLFDVFIDDTDYDNQFDALSTMSDILMYAKRQHIELNLNPLKMWREKHDINSTTSEILECA